MDERTYPEPRPLGRVVLPADGTWQSADMPPEMVLQSVWIEQDPQRVVLLIEHPDLELSDPMSIPVVHPRWDVTVDDPSGDLSRRFVGWDLPTEGARTDG